MIEGGREPLAANMTSREGFRFGITQLAASMIGVGLDELIQRDNKRRRRRLQWITTGALTFAGMMSVLTWTAFDARQEAETSRNKAETSRNESEKLVQFLITDLKDELATLGRTSILNDLGQRISDYYDAIPLSDMDRDRLARQAETRHLLGQVALDQRDLERAESEIQAAFNVTEEILRRNPDDTDAIFDHAQSAFWIGELHKRLANHDTSLKFWKLYLQYGQDLLAIDPKNKKWIKEAAFGENNVGNIYLNIEDYDQATFHFELSIQGLNKALSNSNEETETLSALANSLSGYSKSLDKLGRLMDAYENRKTELNILEKLVIDYPQNISFAYENLISSIELYQLEIKLGISECSYENAKTKLDEFAPHLKNDPENEEYIRDYTHFRYLLFKYCQKQYSSETRKKEARALAPLIEKSTFSNKTQFLDFVNSIGIE